MDNINSAVQLFNDKLKSLVNDLNTKFTDSKFTYINIFGIGSGDPRAAGINPATFKRESSRYYLSMSSSYLNLVTVNSLQDSRLRIRGAVVGVLVVQLQQLHARTGESSCFSMSSTQPKL